MKTTAGSLELERPRARNASALEFGSAIVGKGGTRTHVLETLVIASFLRELSVRDVEAAGGLGRSGGLEVDGQPNLRLDARALPLWCGRRLCEHGLVYCFLDAISLKLRPDDEPAEGVLCA